MKTKTQLTFAWSLVVVLAILLAITGFFLMKAGSGEQNISEKRDAIREHCSQSDAESRKACAKDLQEMSDILREFSSKTLPDASINLNP
jgi:hypothetical protein